MGDIANKHETVVRKRNRYKDGHEDWSQIRARGLKRGKKNSGK
jgi:hypothetical protein